MAKSPSIRARIRDYLRANPDGAITSKIADAVGASYLTVYQALDIMPDTYIDRWQPGQRGQFAAVWCVVDVPENCPRPEVAA